MKILTANTKLKADGIVGVAVEPVATCPCAGDCKKYCYATKGMYRVHADVCKARWDRIKALINSGKFAIETAREIAAMRKKPTAIRINTEGDLYSASYFRQIIDLCKLVDGIQVYLYTKSVNLVKSNIGQGLPSNLSVIFSFGGIQDGLIDVTKDRHCRIFDTKAELEAAGYVDVSESDLIAATTNSIKIGIVKH
jgi:hypothetical protein